MTHPWINRQATDRLFKEITAKPSGVTIYLIKAPAGVGKTYLARDIGTRLGSTTGYEVGYKDEFYWSGIVDLYDPDTSNGRHIEMIWKQAFASPSKIEFHDYDRERERYVKISKEAPLGLEMDTQLKNVRNAFAEGMQKIAKNNYPVMVFDTVERLRTVLDPTQEELDIQDVDAPDVFEWLFYQIERLTRGVVLMMGRPAPGLEASLFSRVETINLQRKANGLLPVDFKIVELEYLSTTEIEIFFVDRVNKYPELRQYLTAELKALLAKRSHGNPLLLDIALQTLLETKNPRKIYADLEKVQAPLNQEMQTVENALLFAYMNSGSTEMQTLLKELTIARNGLFEELLQHLNPDPNKFSKLSQELKRLMDLPFVKVRDISALQPGSGQRIPRRTYFLHDAMYDICDRIKLVSVREMMEGSKRIVSWYDEQLKSYPDAIGSEKEYLYHDAITDLLVESLPYRMRLDPQESYDWYLDQSDRAIRGIARGRDARLRDAMAQFLGSAGEKGKTGDLPANVIDREILGITNSRVQEDFKVDSALQWLERYSIWGKHEKAMEIANKATWVMNIYTNHPERYLIRYSEFRLWQAQSFMYIGDSSQKAAAMHTEALNDIERQYAYEKIKKLKESGSLSPKEISRICFIVGRLYNNRGYIYWMYLGQYWLAIEEFHNAIRYFDLGNLMEEVANSQDNTGRVYTMLGVDYSTFEAINEGLRLRTSQNMGYRQGLSKNSLALAFIRFDNIPQALEESEGALKIFRSFRVDRGIALARFTHASALRARCEQWRDLHLTVDECVKYLEEAESDLREALQIFTYTAKEPIRQVQTSNELACCYRTLYMLHKEQKDTALMKAAFDRGLTYFDLAIETARNSKFTVDMLDNQQDRAVLYTRAGQYDKAREDLFGIRTQIPINHRLHAGVGLLQLDDRERVDAYYKLMGQVEFLAGTVIYNEASDASGSQPGEDVARNMLEHYVLSIAYYNLFSGGSFTNRQTNHRIYSRLRGYDREFLVDLRDNQIRQVLEKYKLPPEIVREQFNEIFGLLIPGSRMMNWEKFSRQ
jgi:tetratricopeptide (TPR) repeat protein